MSTRYDEVRGRLVERGYLRGPIERFVLSEAPRGIARAAARAALIGAPLLGALLAASTLAANRPLLGARDAAVLWGYFAVLAAGALFVLDLAAGLLASTWARRRGAAPSDALRAGLLVAVPLLAYLVVLWARGRRPGGFAADAIFLAAAVAATALVAWLAGLVSLAGVVGRTGEVPDRHRRPVALALAVLAPIAALGLLVPHTESDGTALPPSPFAVPGTPARLLFVGVDGLDGELVAALEPLGAVDQLLGTIAAGALYPLRSEPGREPAEVWTTIMTGTPANVHGVRSAGAALLPGVAAPIAPGSGPAALGAALRFLLPSRIVPVSGAGRRVRALWEIEGLAAPAIAAGFWSTWPARGIEGDARGGYVLTDRLLAKLLAGAPEDRDVEPESLYARLASDFAAQRESWRTECDARFAALPDALRAIVWESYLIDAFAWESVRRLRDDPRVGAAFVYLPGLDILRTRLAQRTATGDAAAIVASRAIETYVRWLDASVFATVRSEPGAAGVIVVADPGRSAPPQAEGFVAVLGPHTAAACVGTVVGPLDVAPIVLAASGLPASREMPGAPPATCWRAASASPARIASWGRRGTSLLPAASESDPAVIERLKSLGYLR